MYQNQLIGAANQWTFVQKYMDAYIMHGAYWEKNTGYERKRYTQSQVDSALVALGEALNRFGKKATVETGFGENDKDFDINNSKKREAVTRGLSDIEKLKHFASLGVTVDKLRVDWFPLSAAATYATKYHTLSPRELMLRVTGATQYWGSIDGFDTEKANWKEYVHLLNDAFPGIAFAIDQAPCNFFKAPYDAVIRKVMPWQGFGYGYSGLKTMYHREVLDSLGKPVQFHLDFADLMMTVAMLTRSLGMNYEGFEGDTPYSYVTDNKGRMGKDLLPFLLKIEALGHEYGFHSGKIINDNIPNEDTVSHDVWDMKFHDRSLQYLETYQAAGGRADQYIFESWYHGPFTLFPETKKGTFSNLARDAIRRIRGIDDNGIPFKADLMMRKLGDKHWIGEGIEESKVSQKQQLNYAFKPKGGKQTFEITIKNQANELNTGDARATPLIRGEIENGEGLTIIYTNNEGKDITEEILATKNFDGWFCGGIEPGETKRFYVTFEANPSSIKTNAKANIKFQLYWNAQDPKQIVRDEVELIVNN